MQNTHTHTHTHIASAHILFYYFPSQSWFFGSLFFVSFVWRNLKNVPYYSIRQFVYTNSTCICIRAVRDLSYYYNNIDCDKCIQKRNAREYKQQKTTTKCPYYSINNNLDRNEFDFNRIYLRFPVLRINSNYNTRSCSRRSVFYHLVSLITIFSYTSWSLYCTRAARSA